MYYIFEFYPQDKPAAFYISEYQTEEEFRDHLMRFCVDRIPHFEDHDERIHYDTTELVNLAKHIYGQGRGIVAIIEGSPYCINLPKQSNTMYTNFVS